MIRNAVTDEDFTAGSALADDRMLAGLPVALVKAADTVGMTPDRSFREYMRELGDMAPGGVVMQLPGDDGGRSDFRDYVSTMLRNSGLKGEVSWLTDKVLRQCKEGTLDELVDLPGAQEVWLEGARPVRMQARKWERFKRRCREIAEETLAPEQTTLGEVWEDDLGAVPPYSLELMRCASLFAFPQPVPQLLFVRVVQVWVEGLVGAEGLQGGTQDKGGAPADTGTGQGPDPLILCHSILIMFPHFYF